MKDAAIKTTGVLGLPRPARTVSLLYGLSFRFGLTHITSTPAKAPTLHSVIIHWRLWTTMTACIIQEIRTASGARIRPRFYVAEIRCAIAAAAPAIRRSGPSNARGQKERGCGEASQSPASQTDRPAELEIEVRIGHSRLSVRITRRLSPQPGGVKWRAWLDSGYTKRFCRCAKGFCEIGKRPVGGTMAQTVLER
jgi:hypothetical protein